MGNKRPQGGKRGKKVRVDFRRNQSKTARDKSAWTRGFRADDAGTEDARKSENVRAKGALSRKRTIVVGDADEAAWREGVVVAMRGLVAEVDDGKDVWACTVRRVLRSRRTGGRHPVSVGDRVRFSPVEVGGEESRLTSESRSLAEGVIEEVRDRTSTLVRHYDRRDQVIAANVDVAVITTAADRPTLRPHLIDRYLVAVHHGDMRPVVCIAPVHRAQSPLPETIHGHVAAEIHFAGDETSFAGEMERGAPIHRGNVQHIGLLVVGRAIPLDPAENAWARTDPFRGERHIDVLPGRDFGLEPLFVRSAIEHPQKAVLPDGGDEIPLAAFDGALIERADLRQVPVVKIRGYELFVPPKLTRSDIESDE